MTMSSDQEIGVGAPLIRALTLTSSVPTPFPYQGLEGGTSGLGDFCGYLGDDGLGGFDLRSECWSDLLHGGCNLRGTSPDGVGDLGGHGGVGREGLLEGGLEGSNAGADPQGLRGRVDGGGWH